MVVVVGKGGVNLSQAEIRVLPVDFLGTPSIEEREIQSLRTGAFSLRLLIYRNTGRAAELKHRQGGRGEKID